MMRGILELSRKLSRRILVYDQRKRPFRKRNNGLAGSKATGTLYRKLGELAWRSGLFQNFRGAPGGLSLEPPNLHGHALCRVRSREAGSRPGRKQRPNPELRNCEAREREASRSSPGVLEYASDRLPSLESEKRMRELSTRLSEKEGQLENETAQPKDGFFSNRQEYRRTGKQSL